MLNRRWIFAAGLAVASFGVVLTEVPNPSAALAEEKKPAPEDTNLLKGKAAPDFSLKTLDGKEVKLSDLKGKVVLVDFWATWCPPCRRSLPHIEELSKKKELLDKGLVVLAIDAHEEQKKVEDFVKENKYTFTVPLDATGATMKEYKVRGIPTTVIVGRDGTVKSAFIGFGPDTAAEQDKAIDEALKEGAKSARAE